MVGQRLSDPAPFLRPDLHVGLVARAKCRRPSAPDNAFGALIPRTSEAVEKVDVSPLAGLALGDYTFAVGTVAAFRSVGYRVLGTSLDSEGELPRPKWPFGVYTHFLTSVVCTMMFYGALTSPAQT